jgi:hypothetical protein
MFLFYWLEYVCCSYFVASEKCRNLCCYETYLPKFLSCNSKIGKNTANTFEYTNFKSIKEGNGENH